MVNVARIKREASTSPKTEVGEIDTRAPFQSVKAAVSLFGETISTPVTKPAIHKKSKSQVEGVLDKEAEYHFAQKELVKCKSQIRYAETAASKAIPELEKATKTLLDLKDKISSVNESTQSIVEETEVIKMKAKKLEETKQGRRVGNGDAVDAARRDYKTASAELDAAKQELSSLRGDFDVAMDGRTGALQMAEEAQVAMKAQSEKIAGLSAEIERMKESLDQVKASTNKTLEHQAKVSAEKAEAERAHRVAKEEFQTKIASLVEEKGCDGVEEIELKIADTNMEIDALKEQVEVARTALSDSERSAYAELSTAQEELRNVEEEYRSRQKEVNVLKLELGGVGAEIAKNRENEAQARLLAEDLEVELQERKMEFEAALLSERNDKSACCEMVTKLEQLFWETKKAKIEAEETSISAEELQNKINAGKELEVKLELAMKEAEEVKACERKAQTELKERSEAACAGALANQDHHKKMPREEYESLKEKASGAEKIFETKAGSAQAEIEAMKANRIAAELELEAILREIEETDKATEEAFKQAETADAARSMVEGELRRRREEQQQATDEEVC